MTDKDKDLPALNSVVECVKCGQKFGKGGNGEDSAAAKAYEATVSVEYAPALMTWRRRKCWQCGYSCREACKVVD